jgi:hypothetical protein
MLAFIFILVFAGLIYLIGLMIYKNITGRKVIADDERFQQREVTVLYKPQTISIGKYTYPVTKVTRVTRVNQDNSRYIKIEVDDMNKPVHKVPVLGSDHLAEEFIQRICVALRKAGGPNFY